MLTLDHFEVIDHQCCSDHQCSPCDMDFVEALYLMLVRMTQHHEL